MGQGQSRELISGGDLNRDFQQIKSGDIQKMGRKIGKKWLNIGSNGSRE